MTHKIKKSCWLILTSMLIIIFASSCSDDSEKNENYFLLGVSSLQISSSNISNKEVLDYMGQVESAYQKALGMHNEFRIAITGNYSNEAAIMKSKFESAELPTAPTLTGVEYSFTYQLSGIDMNHIEKVNIIAEKVFTNKK